MLYICTYIYTTLSSIFPASLYLLYLSLPATVCLTTKKKKMNRAIPPDCMLDCTDATVLERQRARLESQYDPLLDHPVAGANFAGLFSSGGLFSDLSLISPAGGDGFLATGGLVEPHPFFGNGWPDLRSSGLGAGGLVSSQQVNYGLTPVEAKAEDSVLSEKISASTCWSESFQKRKFDEVTDTKVMGKTEEDPKEKKIKGYCEEEEEEAGEEKSKITEQNTETTTNSKNIKKKKNKKKKDNNSSNETSMDNISKVTDVQKQDYIHVRARRGQATDSHSLAERVRREKISERMKYLQDLVPGCNKITGKAGMLDEIINYVQSLQRQVEFLSMKLAAVNPRVDFNIDESSAKEVFSSPTSSFPDIVMPSPEIIGSSCLQFTPMRQVVSCSGTEAGINPNSEAFLGSSCFNNVQGSPMWDSDLQNLYSNLTCDQGRSHLTAFPSQVL